MYVYKQSKPLSEYLQKMRQEGKTIGFFPTMGALHKGHISLLKEAKKHCDIVVSSIFVNPTQFNNKEDLLKYPRTLEHDLILLENEGCDIVFAPNAEEVYANEKIVKFDLNGVDLVLEGASRPGHFEGVARVVKLLFEIVNPDSAYFGLKDFQQCRVIQCLVNQFNFSIKLHFVPILREESGLAMSSRNVRLTDYYKNESPIIYKALQYCKKHLSEKNIEQLENEASKLISQKGFEIDYFTLVDEQTLRKPSDFSKPIRWVALAAVFAGDVRLIDNLILN